jgi:hypothetical protein
MSGEISLEPFGVKILFVFSVINNYQQAAKVAQNVKSYCIV